MITLYTIALTIACCAALAIVIGADRRQGTPVVQRGRLTAASLAGLAASCAILSTLAYAMSGPNDENLLPLFVGDVTMPMSLGLLAAAMERAARRGGVRATAIVAGVISLGVGTVTLVVGPEAGQSAKLAVLGLFSALTVFICVRGDLPRRGAILVGASTGVYGVYCLLRLLVPFLSSADYPLAVLLLSRGPSTIVAAIVIVLTAWGVILVLRGSGSESTSTILSSRDLVKASRGLGVDRHEVEALSVTVPDLPLHRVAFSRAWAHALALAVSDTVRSVAKEGDVIGEVAPGSLVVLSSDAMADLEAVQSSLQEGFAARLPPDAPTEPPEVRVERLTIHSSDDLRRHRSRTRSAARRAIAVRLR